MILRESWRLNILTLLSFPKKHNKNQKIAGELGVRTVNDEERKFT